MATAVEVVVDTGGTGDYATLAAAEAGEQRDLVTADEQLTIKCQCTTGAVDNSPFTFSGWTVDTTRYIKVWTDPAEGYRHTGKWDDSKYHNVNILSYDYLDFGQVRIVEGLQLYQSAYNGVVGAALLSFDSCIVKGYLRPVGGGIISNCLFLYSGYNPKGIDNNWRGSQYTYNCTFVGIALGMSIVTGNNACVTKNCLFYDCAADYYQSVSTNKTQANCATDNDSAASGLSSAESTHRFEQTFGFVNSGSGDYHLTSSDGGAKGYGTNLYATFTTDIDGQTRPASGAWCIGCDEYVSGGSPLAIEGTFAGSIVSSLAAAGQLGTAGTMSAATGIQGALSGKIGVGGTTAVSVGTFLAASGREGKQGSLTTTIELLAALFGSTGLIETFTGTLDAAIESVASEMTGNAGTSGELVGQILTAAALVGALGVSGDASLDLTDLSGLLTGAIGVSGPWNISVSCGSELAGALGVSGEIIGAVGFLGLRLIEITGDSTVYRILFASKTGGIIMTTRTGTIEWR